jgi:hypothetical protein
MNLFTDGEFHLFLGELVDNEVKLVENLESEEIIQTLLETLNKVSLDFQKDKVIIRGEESWAQIVNSLVKSGFQQDSNFDKLCDTLIPKSTNQKTTI